MGAAKKLIDKKMLQDLVPINALSAVHIEEISRKAVIEDIASRRYVFRKGDRDYQSVYLLEGKVELIGDGREVVATVTAGSETARHPLAHKQPRHLAARASGPVKIARIDSSLLDVLLTWDESAGYDVVEIDAEDDDDWMTRMLQSEAFLQLPPANIHQLLMRLESVNASAGDVIVTQGEEGDYFYIVKSGRLAVTRKASSRSKEVLLAELGQGACFGEEALVSGTRRNASVMMVTDGSLMRLSKDDFNELLRAPLVHEVEFTEAQELVEQGARWLDVRLPGEFENQSIRGSENLPLSALRDQCPELDRDATYVVCCDTGRRSAAGAFVLNQRGFAVYTLRNGLMDVPAEALTASAEEQAAAEESRDAEIIPFDSEAKDEPAVARAAEEALAQVPADEALIEKLAAAENEKIGLQQELQQTETELAEVQIQLDTLGTRLDESRLESDRVRQEVESLQAELSERESVFEKRLDRNEQEKAKLQAELDAARQSLEAGKLSCGNLESEKKHLQEELARLQETLSRIQQSSEGRDEALRVELEQMAKRLEQERQDYGKRALELEQELARVRDDYEQLGQRTGAIAGERDAAARDLEQSQQDLAALQQQLDTRQEALSGELESLNARLEERERQLEEQRQQRESLEQRVTELDRDGKTLRSQLEDARQQAEDGRRKLEAVESQLADSDNRLGELERSLEQALGNEEALKQQAQQAGEQIRSELQLEVSRLEQEKSELAQSVEDLQARLEAHDESLREQQLSKSELEQSLADAERSLQETAERERELQSELEAYRNAAGEKDALAEQLETLQTRLEEQEQQLREGQQQRGELETALTEARQALEDNAEKEQSLIRQLEDYRSEAADRDELGGRLEAVQQQLDEQIQQRGELETALVEARQALEENAQREQALNRELEDYRSEAAAGKAELDGRLETLQQRFDEQVQQREDLEKALAEAEAALEEHAERERQVDGRLQDVEGAREQISAELQEHRERAEALQAELEEARSRYSEATGRIGELESRLVSDRKDYESDIASVRIALSRAQDERDNLSREQSRMLDAVARAEQKLEQARHDHETELYRLRKELKDSEGKAGSGLASELEAMHRQLQDAARQREDLEIKLGERSAQLEDTQAQLEKMQLQLQQAQDSAREAEQQLIEANQAASEEMAVRLEAEESAQKALRAELESVVAERNHSQEQLTVLGQELDELRAFAATAREAEAAAAQQQAGLKDAEQQLQSLRAALQQAEQDRDSARADEQQARREADQLRAEAEVTRGLVDMQVAPADESEEALREELDQAKKNLDIAVRLRGQAEEKLVSLQAETERLRSELAGAAAESGGAYIPSLDADDPQAATVLASEFVDEDDEDEALPVAESAPVDNIRSQPGSVSTEEAAAPSSSGWKGIAAGLLIGGALASGAFWWLNRPAGPLDTVAEREAPAVSVAEVTRPVGDAPEAKEPTVAARKTSKRAPAESFPVARGMPEIPKAAAAVAAAKPKVEAVADVTPAANSAEAVVVEPQEPVREWNQPVRSFRDALSSGGYGPTLVELRADYFAMGSGLTSPNFDERPRHRVDLPRFAISRDEVTFAQYDRFADDTGRPRPADAGWGRGQQPVINVSWEDAVAYAEWLSEQSGYSYRLPSEAEWEFAARSGSDRSFPWGAEIGEGKANCFDCVSQWSGKQPAPVGSFVPSAWGFNDMVGNVMEWVQDCYRDSYADVPVDGSAVLADGCAKRVVRGGSYVSPAEAARTASRGRRLPDARLDDLGFRVVREF